MQSKHIESTIETMSHEVVHSTDIVNYFIIWKISLPPFYDKLVILTQMAPTVSYVRFAVLE